MGRPQGTYITIEAPDLSNADEDYHREISQEISRHLRELINLEKQMIEYLGTEQYIILGLTSKTYIPDVKPINEALKEAFGEHFLDIRSYILQHGLEDAGITPTEQDQKDIADGEIPSSIRVDDIHGNAAFYKIIGEQVGQKLEELGYLTEQDKK